MFFLALIAILLLGVISFGLLKLLSKSISNQRNHSEQESKTTPTEVNPEQEGNEQLAVLIKKIEKYHEEDTNRAKGDRLENLMYVLWGFAFVAVSLALATFSLPHTFWSVFATTVSGIGAIGFFVLAYGALGKVKQYKTLSRKDFWGDKT
jgi:Tfp pilus assembly protein PilV